MKKTIAYVITTIVFIVIFILGLSFFFLRGKAPEYASTSPHPFDRPTNYEAKMKANKDTISHKNENLIIDISLISQLDSLRYNNDSEHFVSADSVLYCKVTIEENSSYSVLATDNERLQRCRKVNHKNPTKWTATIKPLIARGNINIKARLDFFKNSSCTIVNSEEYIYIDKEIHIKPLTFGAKLEVILEKMFDIITENFLIFWTSFVGLIFTFVLNRIKKKFGVQNSN